MKKFLALIGTHIFLFLNFSPIHAQYSCAIQQWEWAKQITSTGTMIPTSSEGDGLGNIYVAGSYEGESNFQDSVIAAQSMTGYFAKYNSQGDLLWLKSLSGDENSIGYITVHENHLFLAVNFKENLYFPHDTLTSDNQGIGVVKLDLEGNLIWAKKVGDLREGLVSKIRIDKFGNVFLTGLFFKYADFDGHYLENEGDERGFVLSLDNLGSNIWVSQLTELGTSYAADIAFGADGTLYVVGSYLGVIEYDNPPSYRYTDEFNYQSILVEYNRQGGKIDVVELVEQGDHGMSFAYDVAVDLDDDIIIGLHTEGGEVEIGGVEYPFEGVFVVKIDASKQILWSKPIINTQVSIKKMQVDSEGNVYVGTAGFWQRLVKLNNDGALLMEKDITEFKYDFTNLTFALSNENLVVFADLNSETQFGDTTLIPEAEKSNLYLALLNVDASLPAPQQSSSHIQFSTQTATSAHLSWENGDGSGRLVLLKKLGKVNPLHIEDGLQYTDGGGAFGAGTQTGEREYVVYVGEGSETTVTGLQANRPYQVAVIEYNDSLSCPGLTNYLQENVAKKFFLTPGGAKFSVYPNPFTNEVVSILLPEDASGEDILSLRDAYGRKLVQRRVDKLVREGDELKLNIASYNLPAGIYYLHMTGQAAIRLIKK